MIRYRKAIVMDNGDARLQIDVPKRLWAILTIVGEKHVQMLGTDVSDPGVLGLRMLLGRLNEQAIAGDLKGISGSEWQAALDGRQREEIILPSDFDRSWLHTSAKLASSYYQVHTHGAGFRARVRSPSGIGWIDLGYQKTAEKAAQQRFYYYLKHEELAYGAAEDEVVAMRRIDPITTNGRSDAEIWPMIEEHLRITSRYEAALCSGVPYLLPGPREPQLQHAAHKATRRGDFPASPDFPAQEKQPKQETERESTWQPPAWILGSVEPLEEPTSMPRRTGRPLVHFERDGRCACGKQWPCPRRDKRRDVL